jgi:hypothetical protein
MSFMTKVDSIRIKDLLKSDDLIMKRSDLYSKGIDSDKIKRRVRSLQNYFKSNE